MLNLLFNRRFVPTFSPLGGAGSESPSGPGSPSSPGSPGRPVSPRPPSIPRVPGRPLKPSKPCNQYKTVVNNDSLPHALPLFNNHLKMSILHVYTKSCVLEMCGFCIHAVIISGRPTFVLLIVLK